MQEGPERIDYQETPDVTEVHAAVKREHSEPRGDVTPIPLWLTALCGAAIAWAGIYMGVFHGGFSENIFDENQSSPVALFPVKTKAGAGAAEAGQQQSLAEIGKGVYGACQTCHQPSGQGVPGQFPPLADSEWVIGSEKRLVAILLKGMTGPVTVKGQQYNGLMPPQEGALNNRKIAAVATYIRTSWGNQAPEISEAKVAAARKEFADRTAPWTAADLQQIPEDATLPDAEGAAPPVAAQASSSAPAAPQAGTAGVAGAAGTAAAPEADSAAAAPPAAASTAATSPSPTAPPAGAAPAGAQAQAVASPAELEEGKKHYMTVCVACHQPNGLGLPMVFPPLAKTEYVVGNPERLAAMILKGNAGPMTIEGKPYNNIMPGLELTLDDAKIASIMTYIRASFGNSAPPVSADLVKATREKFADRKTPWTEPELKAWQE